MVSTNTVLILFFSLIYPGYPEDKHSVIIIGAGSSGIAAGIKLLENGVSDIHILEAEARIGGRVNSVKFGNAEVDLGAEWVYGEKNNIIYTLTKGYDILLHPNFTDDTWSYSKGPIPKDVYADMMKVAEHFWSDYGDNTTKNMTLNEYFMNLYNKSVIQKYKDDPAKLKIVMEGIEWFEHFLESIDSAYNLNELAVNTDYITCEGNQNTNWNGHGFKTILDILMKKYPDVNMTLPLDEKISLSKEVVKINWENNSEKRVTVECADGTTYKAEFVIFTPSVGVLKASHAKLFTPALSKEHVTAIENIGMDSIMKVALHFPTAWWDSAKEVSFTFLWSSEDKVKLLEEFPKGPTKNGKHWLTSFSYFYQSPNNSNVRIAWFSGGMVPDIEKISDKEMMDGCMFAVRHFLGKTHNVSVADSMLRSNWHTNSHFNGAWTHETLKGRNLGVKLATALYRPLTTIDDANAKPQVLFAGEATHLHFFGTVHGAIESGFREAARIIKILK